MWARSSTAILPENLLRVGNLFWARPGPELHPYSAACRSSTASMRRIATSVPIARFNHFLKRLPMPSGTAGSARSQLRQYLRPSCGMPLFRLGHAAQHVAPLIALFRISQFAVNTRALPFGQKILPQRFDGLGFFFFRVAAFLSLHVSSFHRSR